MSISLPPALRARLAAVPLDRALAAGADPARSAALTRRSAMLSSRHGRRRTAAGLRRVLSETQRRPGLSAAVACDPGAVDIARPALEQLERAIRERDSLCPQGLALAHLLLSDPDSVLYRAPHGEALYEAEPGRLARAAPNAGARGPADTAARLRVSAEIGALVGAPGTEDRHDLAAAHRAPLHLKLRDQLELPPLCARGAPVPRFTGGTQASSPRLAGPPFHPVLWVRAPCGGASAVGVRSAPVGRMCSQARDRRTRRRCGASSSSCEGAGASRLR